MNDFVIYTGKDNLTLPELLIILGIYKTSINQALQRYTNRIKALRY